MISEAEKKAILAEVLEMAEVPHPIDPAEFTVGEFAAQGNMGHATALRHLMKLVDEGKLQKRKVRNEDGREVWGFRLV